MDGVNLAPNGGNAGAGNTGNSDGNAGSGNAGNAGGASHSQSNGSPGGDGSASWYSTALKDQANQEYAKNKGWTDLDAAMKSYRELETKFSQRSEGPKAPESPDKYQFKVPTDLPKEAQYNTEFAGWFKNAAHKAGMSQEQAAQVHDAFVDFAKSAGGKSAEAAGQALQKSVVDAKSTLTGEWGAMEGPAFSRNLDLAQRAMRQLGLDAEKMGAATKTPDGKFLVTNGEFFTAMAKVGAGMYAEDSLFGSVDTATNPFDPKTENVAMQGRIVREDRDKAKLLVQAAGREKEFPGLFRK